MKLPSRTHSYSTLGAIANAMLAFLSLFAAFLGTAALVQGHTAIPVVLSRSRHVGQGIVDITDEVWLKGKLPATRKRDSSVSQKMRCEMDRSA
jgi:hypothetical protein